MFNSQSTVLSHYRLYKPGFLRLLVCVHVCVCVHAGRKVFFKMLTYVKGYVVIKPGTKSNGPYAIYKFQFWK